MLKHHPNRIVVPQRPIQGLFDTKFESDPYDVQLFGLLTPEQYTEAIDAVNRRIRRSRPSMLDGVLLAAGPLMVPLAWWGIRHRNQAKKRKRFLKKAINEFNAQYPELLMRWNRKPQSKLTIERKQQPEEESAPDAMAHAQLVSDVVAHVEEIPSQQQPPISTGSRNVPTSSPVGHSVV